MKKIISLSALLVFTLVVIGLVIAQTNRGDDVPASGATANLVTEPTPHGDMTMTQRDMMMHVGMLIEQADDMYRDWHRIYTHFDEMIGVNNPEELHGLMDEHKEMMEDFNRRTTELHIQYQALMQGPQGGAPGPENRSRMDGFADQRSEDEMEYDTSWMSDTAPTRDRSGEDRFENDTSHDADHEPARDSLEDATEDTMKQDTLDW